MADLPERCRTCQDTPERCRGYAHLPERIENAIGEAERRAVWEQPRAPYSTDQVLRAAEVDRQSLRSWVDYYRRRGSPDAASHHFEVLNLAARYGVTP